LELSGEVQVGKGTKIAKQLLESGKAMEKFTGNSVKLQGRFNQPELAPYKTCI